MIASQFSIYILVGIVSALIDVGLMQLLISFGLHHLIAASCGFFVGLIVNFLLHSRITFKEDYSHSMLARYITVVLANYVLVLIVIQIFNSWLSMPIVGKLFSLPLVALNGFFLSKYWIYKTN
tara:strand:+ start:4490 stop:4858 length:369 start_codon:yes stop_codon:yes gene_type:complete